MAFPREVERAKPQLPSARFDPTRLAAAVSQVSGDLSHAERVEDYHGELQEAANLLRPTLDACIRTARLTDRRARRGSHFASRPTGRAPRLRSNHRRRGSRRCSRATSRAGPSSDDGPPSSNHLTTTAARKGRAVVKCCSKCRRERPAGYFRCHPTWCRDCYRTYRRRYRAEHPEYRKRQVERIRDWRKRNPEKRRAHKLVEYAIKGGSLKREPCESCGRTTNVHSHHEDYSAPLDVRWLCAVCHAAEHGAGLGRER
jgi:hypothetical protein